MDKDLTPREKFRLFRNLSFVGIAVALLIYSNVAAPEGAINPLEINALYFMNVVVFGIWCLYDWAVLDGCPMED